MEIIDYGLNFTTKGHKPYLIININKYAIFKIQIWKLPQLLILRSKFLVKYNKNNLMYFIQSELTFQMYFLTKRDSCKFLHGCLAKTNSRGAIRWGKRCWRKHNENCLKKPGSEIETSYEYYIILLKPVPTKNGQFLGELDTQSRKNI